MNKKTLSGIFLSTIWVMCISEPMAQDTDPDVVPSEEPEELEAQEVEPWVPPMEADATVPEPDYPIEEPLVVDHRPYGKGAMELGLGLGGVGGSGYFSLSVGASFAYFVVPRLAPGISLNYQAIFGDLEYPQSFTTLPYLKFILIRSRKFAPFLVGAVGREFQWAGTNDPSKGYPSINSWITGGGVGAHIGIGTHVTLMLQVMFLYYHFDEKVLVQGEADPVDGHLYTPITVGMSIFF